MAEIGFRGDAVDKAQVTTIAVTGTWAAADTATFTINSRSITITIGTAVTIADVVAACVAAWNGAALVGDESRDETGDNIAEFNEITASGSASPITLTADTKGVPFTVTVAEVTAGSGALGSPTDSTANSGKNSLKAENLVGGALPGAADSLTFENTDVDCKYHLDTIAAVGTLTKLEVMASFEADLGLPRKNASGSYYEYRQRYVDVDVTEVRIGEGSGNGSALVQLDIGAAAACTLRAFKSDSSNDDMHAIRVHGSHASHAIEALGTATIDVAPEEDQSGQFATVHATGTAQVRTSNSVTLGSVYAYYKSKIDINSAAALTDITLLETAGSGKITLRGDNDLTTASVYGQGLLELHGVGTITTLNLGPRAKLDASNLRTGVTITNCTAEEGATILDPNGLITWTNAIDLGNGNLKNFNFDFGDGRNVKPS